MKKIKIVSAVVVGFVMQMAAAASYSPETYPYPVPDPLLATILSAANFSHSRYQKIYIEPRPERRTVTLVEKRNKLTLGLFAQKNKHAPLAFVIAGVGGSGMTGSTLLLAEQLFAAGYTAVTLPDPISWQYVLGVSKAAAPGFLERDAREYYEFLKYVKGELQVRAGIRAKKFVISGYSFGGLLTGFLLREDNEQKVFNFSKALIINPAIDLGYGVDVLDAYYAAGAQVSEARKRFIMALIFDLGGQLLSGEGDLMTLFKDPRFRFSEAEKKWLVGDSFRGQLGDMIFVAQQVRDTGVLKTPATKYRLDARLREAKNVSFYHYVRRLILPSTETEADGTVPTWYGLVERNSLYALQDILKNDSRVVVFENADDILVKPGDLEFLSSTLGERLYLYPFGGHLGNLAHPINKANLMKVMAY